MLGLKLIHVSQRGSWWQFESLLSENKNSFILLSTQYLNCWWPAHVRCQGISGHGINLVIYKYSFFNTSWVKIIEPGWSVYQACHFFLELLLNHHPLDPQEQTSVKFESTDKNSKKIYVKIPYSHQPFFQTKFLCPFSLWILCRIPLMSKSACCWYIFPNNVPDLFTWSLLCMSSIELVCLELTGLQFQFIPPNLIIELILGTFSLMIFHAKSNFQGNCVWLYSNNCWSDHYKFVHMPRQLWVVALTVLWYGQEQNEIASTFKLRVNRIISEMGLESHGLHGKKIQ